MMPAVGKVRPRHSLENFLERGVCILQHVNERVAKLAQVVGRDVRGHADGDARGAVQQQVGHAGGEHGWLRARVVVIGYVVDGVFFDVGKQVLGEQRHPRLGVAHGRRRIPVHGAEVALPIHQEAAQGEVLRHARQRRVDHRLTVWVIVSAHVACYLRAFAKRLVVREAQIVECGEDTPLNWLESVAHVGQGARDDDAHRVVHEGRAHFLLYADLIQVIHCLETLLATA